MTPYSISHHIYNTLSIFYLHASSSTFYIPTTLYINSHTHLPLLLYTIFYPILLLYNSTNRDFPHISKAIRAEFARGDGRVKRKEDDRRNNILPNETLFIVNFSEETTKREDLEMLFSKFGDLVRIDMKRNYAFVQFTSIDDATKAKNATNGGKLDQNVITVECKLIRCVMVDHVMMSCRSISIFTVTACMILFLTIFFILNICRCCTKEERR